MIDHALIFAAGRGERMRPLSDTTPKPLLRVGGKRLIEWHLEKLAAAGVRDVVVNTSHLAEQFPAALGDGGRWGLRIAYSYEGPVPLETGGGMLHALPLLGPGPFIAVNGDIRTDFDFATLAQEPAGLASVVLVDNPPHNPRGDFGLDARGRLHPCPDSPGFGELRSFTFAGIAAYRPELLAGTAPGTFSIVPILRDAMMTAGRVDSRYFGGAWSDVGTPERLAALEGRIGAD